MVAKKVMSHRLCTWKFFLNNNLSLTRTFSTVNNKRILHDFFLIRMKIFCTHTIFLSHLLKTLINETRNDRKNNLKKHQLIHTITCGDCVSDTSENIPLTLTNGTDTRVSFSSASLSSSLLLSISDYRTFGTIT